jgi:hypothetical protein
MTDVPVIKILLLYYALIASRDIHPLLSKQLKEGLESSRISQHIVGIMTLLIIISFQKELTPKVIMYTVIGYLWFILSSKMDLHWTVTVLLMMVLGYFYETKLDNKIYLIKNDNIIDTDEKYKLIKDIQIKKYYLYGIIFSTTVFGSWLYSNRKELQYGGKYNLANFLLF